MSGSILDYLRALRDPSAYDVDLEETIVEAEALAEEMRAALKRDIRIDSDGLFRGLKQCLKESQSWADRIGTSSEKEG